MNRRELLAATLALPALPPVAATTDTGTPFPEPKPFKPRRWSVKPEINGVEYKLLAYHEKGYTWWEACTADENEVFFSSQEPWMDPELLKLRLAAWANEVLFNYSGDYNQGKPRRETPLNWEWCFRDAFRRTNMLDLLHTEKHQFYLSSNEKEATFLGLVKPDSGIDQQGFVLNKTISCKGMSLRRQRRILEAYARQYAPGEKVTFRTWTPAKTEQA